MIMTVEEILKKKQETGYLIHGVIILYIKENGPSSMRSFLESARNHDKSTTVYEIRIKCNEMENKGILVSCFEDRNDHKVRVFSINENYDSRNDFV